MTCLMTAMPNDNQLRRLFAQNIGEDKRRMRLDLLAMYRLAPNVDADIHDPSMQRFHASRVLTLSIVVGLVITFDIGQHWQCCDIYKES